MNIVEQILTARGIDKESFNDFLNPDYSKKHDPFLLPDMRMPGARTLRITRRVAERV